MGARHRRSSQLQRRLVAIVAASLLVGACGTSSNDGGGSTQPGGGGGNAGGGGGGGGGGGDGGSASSGECNATERLAEINAELEGLGEDERRAALIELAQEEGGIVSFYGSTSPQESIPWVDAFQDSTGIAVRHYRATAASITQRVLEEHAASYRGVDVIGGDEFPFLDAEGVTAWFDTPYAEQIAGNRDEISSFPIFRIMRVAAWNTDRIPDDQAPGSWEDVLLNYPSELIYDPGDWDWFGQIIKDYFIPERGMTEEEAVELFKESARGAVAIAGHTLGTQLMVSGEYGMTAVSYHHAFSRFPDDAPIGWEPLIPPVIFHTVDLGIAECALAPAAALLFSEWALSLDGQELFLGLGRTTTNVNVGDAWPVEYNDVSFPITMETIEEREKWEALWEEVLRESGTA